MATGSNLTVFYITRTGARLAKRIADCFPDAEPVRFPQNDLRNYWRKGAKLVFIMAAGIVVRAIAPLLNNKRTDPAVVVLDEKGKHAISLLGGHLAGANALAEEIAQAADATPVLTTASDINGLPAIDLWAEEQGLAIEDWKKLPRLGTRLVNRKRLCIFSEVPLELPEAFVATDDPSGADMAVTHKIWIPGLKKSTLLLRPKNVVVGIGCNSGTSDGEIADAVEKAMKEAGLSFLSVSRLATIDRKADEAGIVRFAEKQGLPILTFTAGELNEVRGVTPSEAARKATGAQAVAEPAALLASEGGALLVPKRKSGNVTVAVAQRPHRAPARKGTIYVAGTGPGGREHITPRARSAIRSSGVVVGYRPYIDLLQGLAAGKHVVATGMTQEMERCTKAIDLAAEGKTVSLISGGDPGIYAMAGLVLELLRKEDGPSRQRISVEIIPGISALNACAARLGAPLMHDFASISLSDRLTPWQKIEDRLNRAAQADFVIVLYNPRSRGREAHVRKAQQIIMRHRTGSTPVGIVKAATRQNEDVIITDLEKMPFDQIDMQTTVIIGNSQTFVWNNRMITPRGYENKER